MEDGNGGGGGSYNAGTNQSNTAGFQAGMGQVIITKMTTPCVSNLTPVTVTVNAIAAPVVAGNTTLCANGAANTTLTASGSPSGYAWYANANGTGALGSNAAYTTPNLNATTTYYVQSATPASGSLTLNHTGSQQSWTVPAGVTTINFTAAGAKGGNGSSGIVGGNGARLTGTLAVTPGQTIYFNVGGQGSTAIGGFNGGGNAGSGAGGGGGATDIRIGGNALANRVIVAAGGGGAGQGPSYTPTAGAGGAGSFCNSPWGYGGGAGGGCSSGNVGGCSAGTAPSYGSGGAGAGLSGGGAAAGSGGGVIGQAGSLGQGGNGSTSVYGAGGGGGGYYGGSAGMSGSGGCHCGGGGGSSFANQQVATNLSHTAGNNASNGYCTITWSGTGCVSAMVPVTIAVNAIPAAPSANAASICTGQTATLNASANANWYTVPSGGASIGQAQAYTTPSLNNTITYYMEGVNGPCVSATRTPVTVTVNAGPATNAGTSIVDASTCGKNTVNVGGNALAAGQSGQWTVLSAANNAGIPGVFSM